MNFMMNLKRITIVLFASLILTACATSGKKSGKMQGDVYTGTDTVEFLASGVKDRVFFATNKSTLTTAASSVDRLDYIVLDASNIHAVATLAYS